MRLKCDSFCAKKAPLDTVINVLSPIVSFFSGYFLLLLLFSPNALPSSAVQFRATTQQF